MSLAAASVAALHEEPARGASPVPDYVMSRYADGRVPSRYRELKWDWTPYSPNGRPLALNFMFWGDAEGPLRHKRLCLKCNLSCTCLSGSVWVPH